MENIPFKEAESVSNDTIMSLVFLLVLIAVVIYISLKFLKQKGFIQSIDNRDRSSIHVSEVKRLSKDTVVYLVEIEGVRHAIFESSKQTTALKLSEEHAPMEEKVKDIDES